MQFGSNKVYDVMGICNALVDILMEVTDEDIKTLGIRKGVMHLVDQKRQKEVLDYLKQKKQTIELGGSSLNALRTLAALGKKTIFAGMIGDDQYGERVKRRLEELNIKNHLDVSKKEATGTCIVLITPDGERTMNTYLGASRLYDESLIQFHDIARSKILHFCGYQWDTEGQKRGIKAALKAAKENDTLVSFDLADPFVVERNTADFRKVIDEYADIVFANKEEASLLYNSSPEETAKKIAASGATAVVKLGGEGALICSGTQKVKIAPVPTKVVDTTAAGDMFAAGFLYGFVSGKPLEESGRIAATLASDVISRIGATVSADAIKKCR